MPGLDGTGPMGDGRPGRGLGRCSKTRQTQRSDKEQPSGMRPETDASLSRGARTGGGRGRCGSGRRGRMGRVPNAN
jgi:hypothetical protein